MVLAIDASRTAEPQKTGVGWYCHHLLRHLKDVIPHDVRVILYSDQPLPEELRPWPENWEERVLRWPPCRNAKCKSQDAKLRNNHSAFCILHSAFPRWPLWSQLRLAAQVLRDRPDVLVVPAHVIPIINAHASRLTPHACRIITTIHDVVFKQFPESYSRRERWYAGHATRLAVRHADRIIVPTQHVAAELEQWYGCDPGKVTVIHHGVEYSNAPTTDSNASNSAEEHAANSKHSDGIRSIRMFPDRFILYVGRLERKKNVARMVEAFSRIAPQHPVIRLVLAGPSGFGDEEVRAAIDRSPVRDRIIETGWVDQAQYHRLLSAAATFLFPTLGEGFGLPILEAMAAGVPVITSRGGAHGEVAGNAALLIDPESTEEIAAAIDRTLRDANLRSDLVRRGQQRAAAFTWQRSAQATWCVLQSVLST